MSSTVTYQCPNCGAGLLFDADKQKFCCEFCLSEFEETELEGTDAHTKAEEEQKKSEEFCEHMLVYYCPNCGAQVTAEESTAADLCAFCHSPIVLEGKLAGELQPSRIIPFAFDKEEAKSRFLAFSKKKWLVPRDFFSPETADKISGVYFPFWVTDADTDSSYDTMAHRVRRWSSGNKRYTEVSDYKVYRRANIHFEDIVTSALTEADKEMLEGVLPYPSDSLREFSMPYLLGYVAKKRDINRDELTGEVRGRMNSYATTILRSTIHGYSMVDPGLVRVNVKHSHWEYALMPIWILNYERKGKKYTFAMNGHTEKIYGKLPVSMGRLSALFGAVAGAVALIVGALGVLML